MPADGACIIDVRLNPRVSQELARYSDLRAAATSLTWTCVQGRRSGGSVGGYGIQRSSDHNMTIQLTLQRTSRQSSRRSPTVHPTRRM